MSVTRLTGHGARGELLAWELNKSEQRCQENWAFREVVSLSHLEGLLIIRCP